MSEVRTLLDSAVVLFRAKLRNQRKIDASVACDKDARVFCALGEIRQVLVNLIANAVDAMPLGGKLLLRGTRVPHPTTLRSGVRISVVDHGSGISSTTRHKLFEPFFTTKGNTGTGLWPVAYQRHHRPAPRPDTGAQPPPSTGRRVFPSGFQKSRWDQMEELFQKR